MRASCFSAPCFTYAAAASVDVHLAAVRAVNAYERVIALEVKFHGELESVLFSTLSAVVTHGMSRR